MHVGLQNHIATLEATIKEIAQRKPDDSEHSEDLEIAARFAEKLDKWLRLMRAAQQAADTVGASRGRADQRDYPVHECSGL
jgi:adenylate kinase